MELTEQQLKHIVDTVYRTIGVKLHKGKRHLVQARLMKRMRRLGISSYDEYLSFVEEETDGNEFSEMINILTTNKTEFFRERRHFDFLKDKVFPEYESRTLRIWSAGCSSGEEVYSLAIHILEYLEMRGVSVKILGTDISSTVLEKAKSGVYPEELLKPFPEILQKYFKRLNDVPGMVRTVPMVGSLVRFARLNLFDLWPMKGPFDIIFCRNVMIYFDKEHQQKLVQRFYDYVAPGGYLFVGHSESLAGMEHRFGYVQPAVYRK